MAARGDSSDTPGDSLRVLVVDDDRDIRDVVQAVLTDEGYAVSTLSETDHESIAATVNRLEPDCILLDGADGPRFGGAWEEAAYLAGRARRVPTVMFTAHAKAVAEARERTSDRAAAADFAAVVAKPFVLDELLEAVETATGRSQRFDRSDGGEQLRTAELVEELHAGGAVDIRTSGRREWATFVSPRDGCLYQLYWWERSGVYIVGRYDDDARLSPVGRYLDRAAAIAAALQPASRVTPA